VVYLGNQLSLHVLSVYVIENVTDPELIQILPTQSGPEGVFAIPERNLLVVASENDERESKLRSAVTIYELVAADAPVYPTLISGPIDAEEPDGPFIPFSALSGLASDGPPTIPDGNQDILYSVEDSFYKSNRMFIIDVSSDPATVTGSIRLSDSLGTLSQALAGLPEELAVNTSAITLINEDDQSVNLDFEGISKSVDGGFWLVSEGGGTIGDEEHPYEFPNMLLKVSAAGVIQEVIFLPDELAMVQLRYGFEGVAEDGDYVVSAMQRAWNDEPNPRLAIYNKTSGEFTFVFYPLDEPESQAGGWVGVGDLAPLGDGMFLTLERDDQFGPDAAIKKLYKIDLGNFSMGVPVDEAEIPTVEKTLVLDVIPAWEAATNAKVVEKLEGLAVTASGNVYIINDNDGVDDNSGEQILLDLGVIPLDGSASNSSNSTSEDGSGSGAFTFDKTKASLSCILLLGLALVAV
jgi:hypothetical protein